MLRINRPGANSNSIYTGPSAPALRSCLILEQTRVNQLFCFALLACFVEIDTSALRFGDGTGCHFLAWAKAIDAYKFVSLGAKLPIGSDRYL